MPKRSYPAVLAAAMLLAVALASCLTGEVGANDVEPQQIRAQVSAGSKQALEAAKRIQCSYTLKEINLDRGGAIAMHATGREKASGSNISSEFR